MPHRHDAEKDRCGGDRRRRCDRADDGEPAVGGRARPEHAQGNQKKDQRRRSAKVPEARGRSVAHPPVHPLPPTFLKIMFHWPASHTAHRYNYGQ
ncbi:hypothetical protein GCM10029978_044950 [Actinoallomurus acanthiterrae]